MQDYPQDTLDLVEHLFYDDLLSRAKITAKTGLTTHQLREIYSILELPSAGRKKQRTVQAEIERQCLQCEIVKPIDQFEKFNMLHRDGSPRISYSKTCLDCSKRPFRPDISESDEAKILALRAQGYGKYPISIATGVILKRITKLYAFLDITGDPTKPKEYRCIVCQAFGEPICASCEATYKQSKIKPPKIEEPKQYKNYAYRIADPIQLTFIKDFLVSIDRALLLRGYAKGRKDPFDFLPYTPQELFDHISKLREDWMIWDNRTTAQEITWKDDDPTSWAWKIKKRENFIYSSLEDEGFANNWALSNLIPAAHKSMLRSNYMHPNRYSRLIPKDKEPELLALRDKGLGTRKIAVIFGVDRSTVQYTLKRLGLANTNPPLERKQIPTEKECIGCREVKPIDQFRLRMGKFANGDPRPNYESRCFACCAIRQYERTTNLMQEQPRLGLDAMISWGIWHAIKSKQNSVYEIYLQHLSFTIDELVSHIEAKFESWMTWDNWGRYYPKLWRDDDQSTWVWNIDHIIPRSTFTYMTYDDQTFKECWALSNLRPYSAKQNVIDGAKRTRHK